MANGTFDCVDINECEVNNGNCSQNCNNFKGSYNCSCQDNFELNEDNLTCSSETLSFIKLFLLFFLPKQH